MWVPFLLGAGVGYVLGAKAGHERYDQLARAYRRVADNPTVQGAAGVARAKAGEALSAGYSAARDRVTPGGPPPRATGGPTTNGTRPRDRATTPQN